MSRVEPVPPPFGRQKRALDREEVSILARLELPGSTRSVRIIDLHKRGARLELTSPPSAGATALLKWRSHECFSTVVWADGSECGLAFDFEVGLPVVSPQRVTSTERSGHVAAIDKIQLGTKRTSNRL